MIVELSKCSDTTYSIVDIFIATMRHLQACNYLYYQSDNSYISNFVHCFNTKNNRTKKKQTSMSCPYPSSKNKRLLKLQTQFVLSRKTLFTIKVIASLEIHIKFAIILV